jgi:sugar O-acyltransferase (sialic acid O-acetyltransferase NeuD family)
MTASIFVFGASGHAKVVIDIMERITGTVVAFVIDDEPATHGRSLCGYPIVGGRDALVARRATVSAGIVAIGDNASRCNVGAWLATHGFRLASAVHPAAAVSRDVAIGEGTAVMAGTAINRDTTIGAHVIVNTGATVDHDCVIAEGVHIGPGCHLCGGISVGARSLLGAGTTVIPGVRIGENVLVGAGSTVVQDVPDGARVAGSPCRPIGQTR